MATRTAALSRRVGVEAEPLGAPTASLASVPAAAVLVAVAAGAVLGVIYTLSPLTVWFAAASVLLIRLGTRGLPAREARWIGS